MKKNAIILGLVAIAITQIIACSKSSDNDPYGGGGGNTDNSGKIQITANATFGNILTDGNGKTLYFFAKDANGSSACTGGCLSAWPVYYSASLSVGTGLNSSDFGTITRADGSKQTTFKGWPLYYYAVDSKAGDVKGDAADSIWFVARNDYAVMIAQYQLTGNDGKNYLGNYQVGDGLTMYITDQNGVTLYSFKPDKNKLNTYTKPDFSNNGLWPIDSLATIGSIPAILKKADFDTIHVYGKPQLTYKGWPLYYFGPDNNTRGNTKGVSVPTPGVWPINNAQTNVAPAQ